MTSTGRLLIVGGVAGGASAAARARRLCETSTIVVYDRGPFVSFANCGLPYYVGDVITEESNLIVASPQLFRERFNIEVRVRHEVTAIDRARREIAVTDLESGRARRESYDALVLAPGAVAVRPPVPGVDRAGVFVLRTIPDSRRIRDWIREHAATRAVIVGGGFIGIEMAENLSRRGLQVTVIDLADQVLPPFDPEMAFPVEEHLRARGIAFRLGDGLAAFEDGADAAFVARTQSGATIPADLAILGVGVRPETTLARDAGLDLGERGGIRVDAGMRSSDPHIWAVGDAVEVTDVVTGQIGLVPLAGPANRQGRIAADNICGRPSRFRGVQATTVVGAFGLTAAATGAGEKALLRAGRKDFEIIYLHPGHHVGYFPGARPIHMKLIFRRQDGRILGAQAVGEEGVERRIDIIAMAIQKEATVFDLEEAELCYAPQFGAAKDPVNFAGMIAANCLRGDMPLARWPDAGKDGSVLVDVRQPAEFDAGHIPGAINIPLTDLRARLGELPRDREVQLYCGVGQRSYYATRVLLQNGISVRNLPGGLQTWRSLRPRHGT
ncbi:MAG TPA: FAD-dependent oxidoreductase [Candidatus Polarisedimenticolia bacterium]|nr:FAD-dependent oxidoreductase [Candidatus Polarisedimenticolia bacterium]